MKLSVFNAPGALAVSLSLMAGTVMAGSHMAPDAVAVPEGNQKEA